MPETKTKHRPAARKQAAAHKPAAQKKAAGTARKPAAERKAAARKAPAPRRTSNAGNAAKRTTELSEDVLKELEDGAQSAIEAVRKFLGTVDEALPPQGDGHSRREEIADSALEMAQRLVHTQSEFLRKVVHSAGKSLNPK
jgi:membrane protein involved in colicin uptake